MKPWAIIFERKMHMSKLNKESFPEFIGQIIDVFEDFCTDTEIVISNDERHDAILDYIEDTKCASEEEAEKDCEFAIIYGDDYDHIADEIRFVYENNITVSRNDLECAADNTISAFNAIILTRGAYKNGDRIVVTDEMNAYLKKKLDAVFDAWEI
jgi:hypothetical protein